ncbi:DUF167 domain-containing protein [Thermogladius sp. 4427co]|uniref:DUF167 domain-containing protein n=1 Tax=Thermogladius sp. 4427co TaxID=3450718 RepID=UPI003F78B46F
MTRLEEVIRRNIEPSSKGVILNIFVQPNSQSEGLIIEGNDLVFMTTENDEKGRSNSALIRFLSRNLNIPTSKIDIVYGAREKFKRVLLVDVDEDKAVEMLAKLIMWPGS